MNDSVLSAVSVLTIIDHQVRALPLVFPSSSIHTRVHRDLGITSLVDWGAMA